jgi:imidazolonepropionase-like amidohydrolase
MTRTLFHGGRVFDGTGAPLAVADIVIEDGRIVEVGLGLDGDEAVDCSGMAVLPGLFDCHVHLAMRYEDFDEAKILHEPFSMPFYRAQINLRRTIELGITTVRDASGADAGLRDAVEEGTWLPSGGRGIWDIEYPGMPSGVCDGVDGVGRKVREVIRAGADVIKIASSGGFLSPGDDPMEPNYSFEEVEAIVKTAADLGTWVMSHAHGAEGIKRAVRAGVRSIDHGTYLDEDAAAMMVERGTWLVPTLTAGDTTEELANDPNVPERVREKLRGLGRPEFGAMRLAAAAGVKVAMGTDCPVAPHGTNLNELIHMAANGFTPEQSLVAATSSAAELMGLQDELGTLEAGKRADVVIVDGDPFAFDTLKERIAQVWKDGVRVVPLR